MAVTPAPPKSLPPSSTVYIRNLEERINLDELVPTLRSIFEDYGTILDIVAKSSIKRKGQAFIVFDNVESATTAIEEVQGFPVFGKQMILEYARSRSDALVQQSGDSGEFERHKRSRLAEKERKQAIEAHEAQKNLKRAAGVVPPPDAARPIKTRGAGLKSTGGAAAVIPDEYLPPNKILFLQNVPEDADVEVLSNVFSGFDGFKEVRLVPGRSGIAFVEYESEAGAISAKERMANAPLGQTQQPIKVTFQRS